LVFFSRNFAMAYNSQAIAVRLAMVVNTKAFPKALQKSFIVGGQLVEFDPSADVFGVESNLIAGHGQADGRQLTATD